MDLGRTLEEWLINLDLGQYSSNLHAAGITEISHLFALDDGFLTDIGVSLLGHRKRILEHLPTVSGGSVSEEDYVNCPSPQGPGPQWEDIYANVPPSVQERRPSVPKSFEPKPSLSNLGSKKKPVPRPRASRVTRSSPGGSQHSPSVTPDDSCPPSYDAVLHARQGSISLKGITSEESSTDDLQRETEETLSTAWQNVSDKSNVQHNFSDNFDDFHIGPDNVVQCAQNELFQFNHSGGKQQTAAAVSGDFADFAKFDDAAKRSSETYEPIWMSTADTRNSEQTNKSIQGLSPSALNVPHISTPEAPPPCRTHFPFEGNVDESFGSASSYPFDSPVRKDFKLEDDAIYYNTDPPPHHEPGIQAPTRTIATASEIKEIHCQKGHNDSTESEELNASFDLPPPEFAPPPLPDSGSTHSVPQDLSEFDPLNTLISPPVPPRTTSDASVASHGYINIDSEPEKCTNKLSSENQDIYSLANFSNLQVTSTPKSKSNVIQSNSDPSLSRSPQSPRDRHIFMSQPSNISVSSDPFRGDDPFGDFHQECQNFNGHFGTQDGGAPSVEMYEEFHYSGTSNSSSSSPPQGKPKYLPRSHLSNSSDVYSMASPVPNSCSEDSSDTADDRSVDSMDYGTINSASMSPVEIVPVDQLTQPRRNEKAGTLYKQGGLKGNKGWRKRWVLFTGNSLRYYDSRKSQVSKRIVPLSCMEKVETLVKDNDRDKFKFNLHTTNRVFQFAAETLQESLLWCSTLMEGILKYKVPPGGEPEGLEMNEPDKQGYLKFERHSNKYYVAVKQGKMCYYHSEQDFKQGSPINEIDMQLAAVKEVGKGKLQLSTHYAHFLLIPESYSECVLWKMAFEEAIADGLGDNTILDQVMENPCNRVCADCSAEDPHWASINIGIVLCKKCADNHCGLIFRAGIHRNFEHSISRVKSLRMDTRIWTPSLVELIKAIGNRNANAFWEHSLPPDKRINSDTPAPQRKAHIENKYKAKLYCDKISISDNQKVLNEMLLELSENENLLETMKVLFSGANIYHTNSNGENAYKIAKRLGQRLTMEFLYQNGGDRTSNSYCDTDEVQAARLRGEVCLDGYLQKTGSKKKDFLRRWCVIEHGCLRYFSSQNESSVAKDSVDNEVMMCVQAVTLSDKSLSNVRNLNKRYPEAFELSTCKKDNREYLFAASTPQEKKSWMIALAKLFCPISIMEDVGQSQFNLAGNFYIRDVSSDWEKSWLMINNRILEYFDKNKQEFCKIDLRKALNIKYSGSTLACKSCIEVGKCLALDAHGRSLYFQADLARDTERLLNAFNKAMKTGGNTLEDQHLSPSNVPVIIEKCVCFIEDYGVQEEGIYRLSGVKSKVQALLDRFMSDAHSVVLQQGETQIHEVAACLKLFLRSLKDPLLMSSKYSMWIENAGRMDPQVKLEWYQFLIRELPPINYNTLKRLIHHFNRLARYSDQNKMTEKNIAIAFGPTLMQTEADSELNSVHVQLQMVVISDIMKNNQKLFKLEDEEKIMQDKVDKGKKILEVISNSRESVDINDSLKISVYFLSRCGNSYNPEVNVHTTVKQVVDQLKHRFNAITEDYTLHEVLCDGALERPLHSTDNPHAVVKAWWNWPESYRKQACLCLKPTADLMLKLSKMYDPSRAKFAEIKLIEKKPLGLISKSNKYAFQFQQSKLSYYKDTKSVGGSPVGSWNIEDLVIYYGMDPLIRKGDKYGVTFLKTGEIPGSKETPIFGRTLCFSSEIESLHWMAAMFVAQVWRH
ncbi:arf-GAP with Rho-GAP domain, ANK repeat and PH domain-containing protein 1-like isoform X4 [Ostrea edulis]|uniref:arf-GAP with Rho-GAP domain, ANK repeat and PH domain-containing protein 1-like isoform X4 n=1 Tax=Ostrea edulis TaxID=37623 RepID=UPI0024AFF9E1|nr:arf-GAP with Rho-GAP domain, ANK repeat and PH domain-containing protein 1-like isoform X4 [Ostrea edulis]